MTGAQASRLHSNGFETQSSKRGRLRSSHPSPLRSAGALQRKPMNSKAEFPPSLAASVNFIRRHQVELALFFCLWFAFGAAANSRNQFEFNLQQAGVEAIVERHHFYLEGSSTPRFQMQVYYYDGGKPFGDVFSHNGHQYAAKQPGQFMTGAIAYFFLHLFGLDYLHHYTLTSVLVSFLTTSLITALAAVAVFAAVRQLTNGRLFWPLVCALIYGLGTTAFVYSGFAYHDAIAAGYLAIAFCFALLLAQRRATGRLAKILAVSCGLLLGLTITTSMLPFFMACVVGLYVIWLRQWKLTGLLMLGGVIGIAPLLFFNSVSFGNPFLNSYMAGGYPESMLHFNWSNSMAKVRLYLTEITFYVPVVWLGILGLAFFPRRFRREQIVLVGLLIAQTLQVLNIESHGGCHYGPRFLLPIMPFVCVSLCGFSYLRSRVVKTLSISATMVLGAISIFISATGALFTAMYCEVERYALWLALQNLRSLRLGDFPLAIWLFVPLLLSVILLGYSIRRLRHHTVATRSRSAA
jgi:hypothetical protein